MLSQKSILPISYILQIPGGGEAPPPSGRPCKADKEVSTESVVHNTWDNEVSTEFVVHNV